MGMSQSYGPADEHESIATIHRAIELGMFFLDTANVYGDGHNERLVGRAIADRRDKVILATKFGLMADDGSRSINGVPQQHRTDHLSAAVRHLPKSDQEEWTVRYQALMSHYGMQPTWNNTGIAHENGDVEQAHHRFKQAVDQALRARGSRDFVDRSAYDHFVQTLVYKRNQTRAVRFTAEREALHPLPAAALSPCKELRVTVSRFSTIAVLAVKRDYL